ncbi:MAG: NAD(P)/FAD-dependent oxidoreductase [Actinomycetota bacterium]
MKDYRSYSLWLDSVPDDLAPRPSLEADTDVDVAIVGAGYTGLWTAYYLATADPGLRIAMVEAEIAGFGASGRNGGWASALLATEPDRVAASHGRAAAIALQRAMFDTVDEVGKVAASEGIDAHYVKGGTLTMATTRAHVIGLKEKLAHERSWGFGEEDQRWLDAREATERVNVTGCLGALFTPHCAAIHPARLARGLARVVERLGVKIYERSPATSLERGIVQTAGARLRADVVVRAMEGYTPRLRGMRRALLPIYSLMIATEPLPEQIWKEVGWDGRETLTDGRHMIIYAQRTADGRIALGGRGAPYHFASRIDDSFDREPAVFAELQRVLTKLFPVGSPTITHRWGGPLAAPRDWTSSVGFDRGTGMAWAGGYVGDGVSTTNLAGRTLRDLILECDSDIARLPWVNHRSRRWEPEPLRWLGATITRRAVASADRAELRSGRPARRAGLIGKLIGVRI